MPNNVTAVPAADASRAASYFESLFEYETDCWDVHDAMSKGAADFVLLDVRSTDAYKKDMSMVRSVCPMQRSTQPP
jgi:hypothetical protein